MAGIPGKKKCLINSSGVEYMCRLKIAVAAKLKSQKIRFNSQTQLLPLAIADWVFSVFFAVWLLPPFDSW